MIEKIKNGNDIMFDINGRHYTILTWTENGIGIGEQFPNDADFEYFKSAEELVDNFMIDGIPLGNIANAVKITEYT